MSLLGGGVPPLLVPLPSSALPAIVVIAITGVIVVLVIAILVVAAHVVVERQYPGCRAIEPQAIGNPVAIHWMKIGRQERWDKEKEQRPRWRRQRADG